MKMPGGLLQLSAYGSASTYLHTDPQLTFWRQVWRRSTAFALESIEMPFSGSAPSFGTKVTVADTNLALAGNDFVVTGAAYTNNDASANTATALYDIEAAQDQLVLQSPPNAGTLVPIGKLGIAIDNDVSGFDILSRTAGDRTVSNTAYAALKVSGATSLYEIDLSSGQTTRIGALNFNASDIAVENR